MIDYGSSIPLSWSIPSGYRSCELRTKKMSEEEFQFFLTLATGQTGFLIPNIQESFTVGLFCVGPNGKIASEFLSFTVIAPPNHIVFQTSLKYSGDLGGLAGADQKCQERALQANAPLVRSAATRVWRAILFDPNESPLTRLPIQNAVTNARGEIMRELGSSNIFDGEPILSLANYDENGSDLGEAGKDDVWVPYRQRLSVATDDNCGGWMSSSNTDEGYTGESQVLNSYWLHGGWGGRWRGRYHFL